MERPGQALRCLAVVQSANGTSPLARRTIANPSCGAAARESSAFTIGQDVDGFGAAKEYRRVRQEMECGRAAQAFGYLARIAREYIELI